MFDCYVIADVSRLNTYIMFMHLKADPASYEGLFEKVNSSVWLPLDLYVLTGEILCHWDTGRVCTDNSGGGWSQEDCLPVRN